MRQLPKKSAFRITTNLRQRIVRLTLIAGLSLLTSHSSHAQCARVLRDGDFELQTRGTVSAPWISEGTSGIDIRRGLSYHERNNAWARATSGWNAIRQPVRLAKEVTYTLKAFVRTSGNVVDGYFGFRNSDQRPVSEVRFGPLTSYRELTVRFRPTENGNFNVFAGLWAPNQDAWIQVDYVRLEYPCEDNIGNPVGE